MNTAISQKNFELAGTLDIEISKLEEKLQAESKKAVSVENEGPSNTVTMNCGGTRTFESREALEKEISSVSVDIEKQVATKNFKEANMLQSDLDKLVKAREALPSMQDLADQLASKQEQMKEAVAKKKFADADQLNTEIDALKERYEQEKAQTPIEAQPKELLNTSSRKVISAKPQTPSSTAKLASAPSRASDASVSSKSFHTAAQYGKRDSRPVSKLKPKSPVVSSASQSIFEVSKTLTAKRANACVIVDESGALAGIITDTDVTRRLVAKSIDPSVASAADIMTANPTCVKSSDSAMDALSTMVENHFRHLPVTDEAGTVVGLLDIAKCLDEAIGKLEKKLEKGKSGGGTLDLASLAGGSQSGSQAQMMEQLLRSLLAQTMGAQSIPTLRTLLEGKPSTFVSPESTVFDASVLMAERRKAALVVDEGELVGIFSFKDMMTRIVAREVNVIETAIESVMTPNPDAVSPDISVLEALQIMHDNRFLTLPVCEQDGTVVGIVDVLDVIYGCGGAEGWRSVINSAMDAHDDASDASSVVSSPIGTSRSVAPSTNQNGQRLGPVSEIEASETRPVSMLRPSKPVLTLSTQSILSAAKTLTQSRSAATLITSSDRQRLVGILTATDITRRVVSKKVDAAAVSLSEVMTKDPTCVGMSDPAVDALIKMIENRFRHLPVVGDDGSIVGVIDIAKCLNAAISKLQRTEKKTATPNLAVQQAIGENGVSGAQAQALQLLLGTLMNQAFGGDTSPTLRSLLEGKPLTVVSPSTSVYEASQLMTEHRKAALVVGEGKQLVGIFGFKDMMKRVVSPELSPESTLIDSVMTGEPRTVSPNLTVIEALQIMHESKILSLPVCEEDGTVVGLVDVLDVMYGCGGSQGWRSIFSSAMDVADDTTVASRRSEFSASIVRSTKPQQEKTVAKLRPSKANIAEADQSILSVTLMLKRKRASASIVTNAAGALAGIITDTDITRRGKLICLAPSRFSFSHVVSGGQGCRRLHN